MSTAKWIWTESEEKKDHIFSGFRKEFEIEESDIESKLKIASDGTYHLWVNGRHIGTGPHHTDPCESSVDSYDIGDYLKNGKNIIAAAVQFYSDATANYVPKRPGLYIEFGGSSTDSTWECRELCEFSTDKPRRNWAIGYPEYLDLRNAEDWTNGESTKKWAEAVEIGSESFGNLIDRPIPALSFEKINCSGKICGTWNCSPNAPEDKENEEISLSEYLDTEKLTECSLKKENNSFIIEGESDIGTAICLDTGAENTGHPFFEIECEGEGTVNVSYAETLQNEEERPWTFRRGTLAGIQVKVPKGKSSWTAWDYSGFRYIHFVFRGFKAKVRINKLGFLSRYANFAEKTEFKSSDKMLDEIWALGERTSLLNAQDLAVDCPTREQALYWGDILVIGVIYAYCFGDTEYYRQSIRQAFQSQMDNGFLPARYPSSANQILYDYSLIPIIMMRDYFMLSDDRDVLSEYLAPAEKVIETFENHIGNTGTVELNGKLDYDVGIDCLFIDHPGLGWHEFDHKGMVRDGISLGLNCFMILSYNAIAEVYNTLDLKEKAVEAEKKSEELLRSVRNLFNPGFRGFYPDVLSPEGEFNGFSQQVNTLAILAGVPDEDKIDGIFDLILDEDNPELARSCPYFYYYVFDAALQHGKIAKCTEIIKKRWGGMLAEGATTTWESFKGGGKDSLCHAWSASPTIYLTTHYAGVKFIEPGGRKIKITPHYDILSELETSVCTQFGNLSLKWKRSDSSTNFEISVPKGIDCELCDFKTGTVFKLENKENLLVI